jgi:hypothetical protein
MRPLAFATSSLLLPTAAIALSACVITTEPYSGSSSPSRTHHHSASRASSSTRGKSSGGSKASSTQKTQTSQPADRKPADPMPRPEDGGEAPIVTGTPFGQGMLKNALKGSVFFIPKGTTTMPDLDKMRARGVLYTTELNIPQRDMDQGFSKLEDRKEWFAIKYEGEFTASVRGEYAFRLVSDDGAILSVDDKVVVNNDGVHTAISKRGTAHLPMGPHKIRVDYFNGSARAIALQLYVTPPSGGERILSTSSPM